MKDNWKKFKEDHHEEFNNESPKDNFFEKIAPEIKRISEPKMIRLSTVFRVAAAAVVLIGVSLYFVFNREVDNSENNIASKNEKIADERLVLAKINPELAETESYYVTQIDQLMEEVENNHLTPEVKLILEQLDAEFNLLKKEMGEQVNSDQIIEALIENYRLKIKLLEKLLNSYNSNTENHEKEIHT
jgi:hypothetical protein